MTSQKASLLPINPERNNFTALETTTDKTRETIGIAYQLLLHLLLHPSLMAFLKVNSRSIQGHLSTIYPAALQKILGFIHDDDDVMRKFNSTDKTDQLTARALFWYSRTFMTRPALSSSMLCEPHRLYIDVLIERYYCILVFWEFSYLVSAGNVQRLYRRE